MTGRPRTTQELIHWLEMGGGARWVRLASLLVCGLAISALVAWRQFHGAPSESTLLQADLARQLASGKGFTTQVNYPQVAAFMKAEGVHFDGAHPYPELYQAPMYPMVLSLALGAVRILPHAAWDSVFGPPAPPPYGFGADYLLLCVNLVLFWWALWLAFSLARRLFGEPAGWLAALALFVSVPAWQQVVAINGSALMMVIVLLVFHAWWRVESAGEGGPPALALGVLGALCGALFLTEYSAGVLVVVAAWAAARRASGAARWTAAGLVAGGFALVAGPWVARNLLVCGLPVGLAVQNIALKAGDATAEPSVIHATLSASLPHVDLNKVSNKALTSLQECLRSKVWSGGAMWLTAFFAAGWLYVFKSAPVNRLRWYFALSFLALITSQAVFNSGDSERQAAGWLCPLIIVFGAGFFFVLLGSHPLLSQWPRACAAALLLLQAIPLLHDALDPRWLHFQYPPYIPQFYQSMARQLRNADPEGRYGMMADVPAGLAWYGRERTWAQPATLHDFYAVQVEQPTGELLLTPKTLDRPFLSDLNARAKTPAFLIPVAPRVGDWGEIYGGLLTGTIPREFPLSTPLKLSENLYVLVNPTIPAARSRP
jgi:hypothetical protein